LLGGYRRSLTWVLDHPALIMIIFVLTLGLNVLLIADIPKGFFHSRIPASSQAGCRGSRMRPSPRCAPP